VHLVQILLPVYGNDGEELLQEAYERVRDDLVRRFGGLTAFTQAPAEGLWTPGDDQTHRDDIVLIEVMVDELDRAWWAAYREKLQMDLKQHSLVIRALPMVQI
jgi:hypothetical protein